MLQELDFELKDTKETINQVDDDLCKLERQAMMKLANGVEIMDIFPYKHVWSASFDLILFF